MTMKNCLRIACALTGVLLTLSAQVQAQTCPTSPGKDVLLFLDNSSSISNAEFDEAQEAIAGIAEWRRDHLRIDLRNNRDRALVVFVARLGG